MSAVRSITSCVRNCLCGMRDPASHVRTDTHVITQNTHTQIMVEVSPQDTENRVNEESGEDDRYSSKLMRTSLNLPPSLSSASVQLFVLSDPACACVCVCNLECVSSPVCFISGLNLHLTTVCLMGKSCQHLAVLALCLSLSVL